MKPSTGYLYVIQAEGLDIVKIGSTRDPVKRGDQIAASSPVKMTFRTLLDLGSVSRARIWEAHVLSWSYRAASHGEWRTDPALVDDLVSSISPAVDCLNDFSNPAQHVGAKRPISLEDVEVRILFAEVAKGERFNNSEIDLQNHLSLSSGWRSILSKKPTRRAEITARLQELHREIYAL